MTLAHENSTDVAESTKAATPQTDEEIIESIGAYQFGWHDPDTAGASAKRGPVSYTHLTLPTILLV